MEGSVLASVPVERLYQAMGEFIIDNIEADWETATLYAEIERDNQSIAYGRYTTRDQRGEVFCFEADDSMCMVFGELRRRMYAERKLFWSKAEFKISRAGKFALQFSYPED